MAWTRSYASRSTGGNDDAAAKEPDHRDSGPGPPGDQQRLVESSRYRHHPHAAYQAAASWTRAAAGLQDQDEAAPRSASEGGLASVATFAPRARSRAPAAPVFSPPSPAVR